MHKAKFSRLQMSPTGNCTASTESKVLSHLTQTFQNPSKIISDRLHLNPFPEAVGAIVFVPTRSVSAIAPAIHLTLVSHDPARKASEGLCAVAPLSKYIKVRLPKLRVFTETSHKL
ncbi:hypothetical protein [Coleofasciculus sp. FACHB-SPT9]|uniref:hypothetical protein n=1 Tax=Cyanophyceae TaxID=3028117 RepID=UPI00168367D6|nr:hypothetical protein [Coleofasciculus sp. FACHB-SPT9]MBD1889158.1 hypothetical protein [Coleofasciculus sp. FACHB-SPT9]